MVGPLGEKLTFFSSLGTTKISRSLRLSVYIDVVLLISFPEQLKQEPYGHLTSASVIIDRFNMVSVGYPHKDIPLLQPISFILNGS